MSLSARFGPVDFCPTRGNQETRGQSGRNWPMKTLLLMASANSSAASCSWWSLRIASPNCQAVTGNEMHRAISKLKRAIALRGAWLYRSKCKEQRDSWGSTNPQMQAKSFGGQPPKKNFFRSTIAAIFSTQKLISAFQFSHHAKPRACNLRDSSYFFP